MSILMISDDSHPEYKPNIMILCLNDHAIAGYSRLNCLFIVFGEETHTP